MKRAAFASSDEALNANSCRYSGATAHNLKPCELFGQRLRRIARFPCRGSQCGPCAQRRNPCASLSGRIVPITGKRPWCAAGRRAAPKLRMPTRRATTRLEGPWPASLPPATARHRCAVTDAAQVQGNIRQGHDDLVGSGQGAGSRTPHTHTHTNTVAHTARLLPVGCLAIATTVVNFNKHGANCI